MNTTAQRLKPSLNYSGLFTGGQIGRLGPEKLWDISKIGPVTRFDLITSFGKTAPELTDGEREVFGEISVGKIIFSSRDDGTVVRWFDRTLGIRTLLDLTTVNPTDTVSTVTTYLRRKNLYAGIRYGPNVSDEECFLRFLQSIGVHIPQTNQ